MKSNYRKMFCSVALLLLCLVLSSPASAQGIGGKAGIGGKGGIGGGVSSFTPLNFVQQTSNVSGNGPFTIVYTIANNTAGNTSCLGLGFFAATGTNSVSSVVSSAGNTYTAVPGSLVSVAATDFAELYAQWWCATGIAGGAKDSLTITFSAAGNELLGAELIEIGPGGVLDQAVTNSGTNTSMSAGSVTTPSNGAFAITMVTSDNGSVAGPNWFTPGSGWTLALADGGGSTESGAEYQAQATTGSITGNLTQTLGTSLHWVASMITIRTH